jgi:hypothetical protein
MKNHLIIHGHFYQPPREEAWTGLVPRQTSAAPFHDWNCRITRECYAANTASRFLRYDGRIEDIINNYEILSFNFGPTLLGWIRSNAPYIYEAILEADARSVTQNGGHGNAIAQSYNHTILPLDSPKDARIQIHWGLRDFFAHFGREAEGIWLPETAVNERVIDILIEFGIRFIILSPWQGRSIQADGTKEASNLGDEPVPYWRSYRIDGTRGSIAAFFYNHELASGISFEHYLKSADSLYTRLLQYHKNADPAHLVHTATDGEVYGHHEPFGDMCLAALRRRVEAGDKFRFTNYGSYLESHPPEYRAVLKKGEEERGTSWSCVHGVSRWYKDCGCSTGGRKGWNQRWRSPLRRAFETLSGRIRELYREECERRCSADPEDILRNYIEVKSGLMSRDEFAVKFLKSGASDEDARRKLFTLLEGNVFRMYMFTSCGWFFADLGGIEPVQNILYALKAAHLFQEFSNEDLRTLLLSILFEAKSNLPEIGTGSDIAVGKENPLPDGVQAASYFFILRVVTKNTISAGESYGCFEFLSINDEDGEEDAQSARIDIIDTTREKSFSFRFSSISEDRRMKIRVKDMRSSSPPHILDLAALPEELRYKISDYLVASTTSAFSEIASSLFDEVRSAVMRSHELVDEPPAIIMRSAELSLNALLSEHMPLPEEDLDEEKTKNLEDLFQFAADFAISLEKQQLLSDLTNYLWAYFDRNTHKLADCTCGYLLRLLGAARKAGLEPDITIAQKIVFSHVKKLRESANRTKPMIEKIGALTEAMGIYADDIIHRPSGPELP